MKQGILFKDTHYNYSCLVFDYIFAFLIPCGSSINGQLFIV